MTDLQIQEEILRYLNDTSYNYAVLIDGEWGSGKTYFFKNVLASIIEEQEKMRTEPRPLKYISLYGCKSILDIQENIAWSFAENAREKIKQRTKCGSKSEKVSNTIMLSSRKIGNAILKKYLPETSIYKITSDWLNLASYIFVFDDFERCDCPLNEVFGFLNELVENESTKVILIANENELSRIEKERSLELQYYLTLDDRIEWPKKEKNSSLQRSNCTQNALSIDEMERRRDLLFPTKAVNGSYRRTREKLIGVTLKYEPNIHKTVSEIIESSSYVETYRGILRKKKEFFSDTMQYYHHKNLRTFQFFLSKIKYIFDTLENVNIDDDYRNKIYDHVVIETFRQTVKFKSNYQPPRNTITWLRSEQEIIFRSIKEYIETGTFEFKTFELEIQKLQNELFANISADDPYSLLCNEYFLHPQKWCEGQLANMFQRLEENKYPVSLYAKIIMAIQRLVDLGFDPNYMQRAKGIMLNNIAHMGELPLIDLDLWFDDRKFKENVTMVLADINKAIQEHSEITSRKNVEEILKYSDWVERLENYLNPTKSIRVPDVAVFSKAPVTTWVSVIDEASPKTIYNFRHLLEKIYPSNETRDSYFNDAYTIKEVFSGIRKIMPDDLIKKASLGWLCSQMESIISLYESDKEETL